MALPAVQVGSRGAAPMDAAPVNPCSCAKLTSNNNNLMDKILNGFYLIFNSDSVATN